MKRQLARSLSFVLLCGSIAASVSNSQESKRLNNAKRDPVKPAGVKAPEAKSPVRIVETIHDYKTVEGRSLKAYVYQSPGDAVRPALITLHPGALMMGQAQMKIGEFGKPGQGKARFIDRGFALISIEYRLAPEAKLPQIVDDLEDAYRWAHDEGPQQLNIDPQKIGVMGTSAGGYLALLSGYRVTPRPRFLISVSGYGDIIGDWYSKPDPFYRQKPLVTEQQAFRPNAGMELYLYCRQNGLWPKVLTGHNPASEPEWFRPYCPVQNVTSKYPPTLLLHGDQDTDVPYQQSERMDQELTAHGVEHEFILNRGAGHGIMAFNPNNNLEFNKLYDRLIEFAIKHVH